MPQSLTFEPITLLHKEQIESLRKKYGNTLYLYTFSSLFSWKEDEKYEICICDDAFIVKNGAEGDNAYLFPCGSDSKKKELIDSLIERGKPEFFCLTDKDRSFLEKEYPNLFDFTDCRNEYPYLYDKNAQIEMRGKTYKSLRHQVNTGKAVAKKWCIEPLSDNNKDRALAVNAQWAKSKAADGPADLIAANTALNNFSKLSMWGLLFQADGRDVAYIAGSFVTPEIFDISFCKVLDNRCDCYIKWALYCALPQETKTVDSEEDMGIEGLRRHKLLRQPKELVRIWKGSLKV